jgi:UDP-N-acetylglucosamine 4,6-dehydratase
MLCASEGCHEIYHLAAIKHVDRAEYDPLECVATNIEGTANVIHAARTNKVEKVVFTSSDKAVEPINIYGASKLVAEKLVIQANIGRHRTKYSVCRYGNVVASNGSAIQRWRNGENNVTDPDMTRFFILPKDAAAFVYRAMTEMEGAEVFVPKMKSTTIGELFRCVSQKEPNIVGVRPGEKKDECLVSKHENGLITDIGWCLVRWPEFNLFPSVKRGTLVSLPSGYTSMDSQRFTKEELEELCRN